MSDDDREELIELGYDPDDITDRNLSIERDGDTDDFRPRRRVRGNPGNPKRELNDHGQGQRNRHHARD